MHCGTLPRFILISLLDIQKAYSVILAEIYPEFEKVPIMRGKNLNKLMRHIHCATITRQKYSVKSSSIKTKQSCTHFYYNLYLKHLEFLRKLLKYTWHYKSYELEGTLEWSKDSKEIF